MTYIFFICVIGLSHIVRSQKIPFIFELNLTVCSLANESKEIGSRIDELTPTINDSLIKGGPNTILEAINYFLNISEGRFVNTNERHSKEIKALSNEMKEEVKALSNEVNEMKEEVKALSNEMKEEVKALSNEMKEEVKALSNEMKALSNEMKEEVKAVSDEVKVLSNEIKASEGRLTDMSNKREPRYKYLLEVVNTLCSAVGALGAIYTMYRAAHP